jgi:hypothetical protein
MNEMVLANRAADWRRLKMLVLDSVSIDDPDRYRYVSVQQLKAELQCARVAGG